MLPTLSIQSRSHTRGNFSMKQTCLLQSYVWEPLLSSELVSSPIHECLSVHKIPKLRMVPQCQALAHSAAPRRGPTTSTLRDSSQHPGTLYKGRQEGPPLLCVRHEEPSPWPTFLEFGLAQVSGQVPETARILDSSVAPF